MWASDVWIVSVGNQEGPVRDRAVGQYDVRNLQTMCLEAAQAAISASPGVEEHIDGVIFATMGVMQSDAVDRLHPRHIASWVARQLNLPTATGWGAADAHQVVLGTSDAGAQGFYRAVQELFRGTKRTVLVVAGEQMLTADRPGLDLKTRRRMDRGEYQDAIQTVVDPDESAPYGLTMLSIGDLLMSHLVWRSGLDVDLWRKWIATVTIRKHGQGMAFPHSMQSGLVQLSPDNAIRTLEKHQARPTYGDWFRAEDVGSPANGATAVILTRDPKVMERHSKWGAEGPWVQVMGMGHGETDTALLRRPLPLFRSPSIRAALYNGCKQARVSPRLLGDTQTLFGVIHDAFPSIELLFLNEIASVALANPTEQEVQAWAISRWLDGHYNPFGGLCANGHALGNTGLYQIAQAVDWIGTSEAVSPRFALVTSVGSALTNIVATLLCVSGAPGSPRHAAANEARRQYAAEETDDAVWGAGESTAGVELHDGTGAQVIGRTSWLRGSQSPRVYLVQTPARPVFAVDASPDNPPIAVGQWVNVAQHGDQHTVHEGE